MRWNTRTTACSASELDYDSRRRFINSCSRQQHAAHAHVRATEFSLKTSTGVLRKHLYEHHADAWVAGCDKLQIPITAKEALSVVSDYRRRQGQPTTGSADSDQRKDRQPFSQEAFVNAIVEFIVADDQVYSFRIPFFYDGT